MRRILVFVATLLAIPAIAAGSASADSLVFIRNANVWIANADGTGQFQVTLDGTAANPYESPSEANDGTIVAVRAAPGQRRQIYRMHQNGELLNPPVNTPAPGTGAIDARVSPDGRYVAYWFVTTVNDPTCVFCIQASNEALISRSDSFTPAAAIGTPNTGGWPSWVGSNTLVLTSGSGTVWYYTIGMPEAAPWFDNGSIPAHPFDDFLTSPSSHIVTLLDGEVSPDGGRLALVRGDQQETLVLSTMTGAVPAIPEAQCVLYGPTGKFVNPTWSQDGQTLAWKEDDGIWSATFPDLTSCASGTAPHLLIAGGSDPDFGPAPVNPGVRPGCGNPGNPTPCGTPTPTPSPTPTPTDTIAPQTRLGLHPRHAVRKRKVTFTFTSSEKPALFQCSLDGRRFTPCRSPFHVTVSYGRHRFRVRALDAAHNIDQTPAVFSWVVRRRH